ncbi:MAG: 4-hydroxy-tetrahydrodipicolinate synthase [Bradymonadia bacterium]
MFHGVYTALITPFVAGRADEEGQIDWPALDALVERQIAAGIDGVVPCGTTGESSTLSKAEKVEIFRRVVATARGRCKVIAGIGTNDTRTTVALARAALEAGADGGLVITPYYNKPTQEGLYHHFRTVAEQVPGLPNVLYNVPSRTGVSLTVDTVDRLADVPGIVAIKEASRDLTMDAEIVARCGDRLAVLSGEDSISFPLWAVGGRGVICVASNLVPERLVALWRAFERGDWNTARALHLRLLPVFNGLFLETNPVPVKTACALAFGGSAEVRLPLVPLQPGTLARLVQLCADHEIVLTRRA